MRADVVIVGAGPAGIAAALSAAQKGAHVTLLDNNSSPGGQIWRRADEVKSGPSISWLQKLRAAQNVQVISNVSVVAGNSKDRNILLDAPAGPSTITYRKLILATGARELFLPFPGWTLPNVMGVGGLQALVKSGLPVRGKRIVVAGTGPLLLAVAAYLRHKGAIVPVIAEQTSWSKLFRFGRSVLCNPQKLWQSFQLGVSLGRTPYLANCWVTRADGREGVQRVELTRHSKSWTVSCDYLAIAYGFYPNTELAELLGCKLERGVVAVNEFQMTSVPDVYCCGESTGIGGVDLSLAEGQIAGHAAVAESRLATRLYAGRKKAKRFAQTMEKAFKLRDELRALPSEDTFICRCEDVEFKRIRQMRSWRSAKLHTRCGMGPCQGRVCGPAIEFLFGWSPASVRPPVFPVSVRTLIENMNVEETATK